MILAIDPGEQPGYVILARVPGEASGYFRCAFRIVDACDRLLPLRAGLVDAIVCETQWIDPQGGAPAASILQLARTAGMQAALAASRRGLDAVWWVSPQQWRGALVRSQGAPKAVVQARLRKSLPAGDYSGDVLDAIGIGHACLMGIGKSRKLPR